MPGALPAPGAVATLPIEPIAAVQKNPPPPQQQQLPPKKRQQPSTSGSSSPSGFTSVALERPDKKTQEERTRLEMQLTRARKKRQQEEAEIKTEDNPTIVPEKKQTPKKSSLKKDGTPRKTRSDSGKKKGKKKQLKFAEPIVEEEPSSSLRYEQDLARFLKGPFDPVNKDVRWQFALRFLMERQRNTGDNSEALRRAIYEWESVAPKGPAEAEETTITPPPPKTTYLYHIPHRYIPEHAANSMQWHEPPTINFAPQISMSNSTDASQHAGELGGLRSPKVVKTVTTTMY
jgi:hypothetical protein